MWRACIRLTHARRREHQICWLSRLASVAADEFRSQNAMVGSNQGVWDMAAMMAIDTAGRRPLTTPDSALTQAPPSPEPLAS
jgi:hypothetical protein